MFILDHVDVHVRKIKEKAFASSIVSFDINNTCYIALSGGVCDAAWIL